MNFFSFMALAWRSNKGPAMNAERRRGHPTDKRDLHEVLSSRTHIRRRYTQHPAHTQQDKTKSEAICVVLRDTHTISNKNMTNKVDRLLCPTGAHQQAWSGSCVARDTLSERQRILIENQQDEQET